jgi:hypothetical protein
MRASNHRRERRRRVKLEQVATKKKENGKPNKTYHLNLRKLDFLIYLSSLSSLKKGTRICKNTS